MNFVYFALLGYLLLAVEAAASKYLLAGKVVNWKNYLFYVSLLSLFGLVVALGGLRWWGWENFLWAFSSGVVFFFSLGFLFFSLTWWTNGTDSLLSFTALPAAAEHVSRAAGSFLYTIVALLIFLGPVAKSAQFPLHTWLPDAMEGPTPISALIHAATMVAAGVYLIARAYPIFEISHDAMSIIAWIGAITAFMAATIAITQQDIKKALAYSTCSQLGFMVMAMGAGAYSAGLFHLMTHAYFKAMLFLCSGAVIHGLHDQQNMKYMGGLRKHMPTVAYTYLIGCLAISGIFLSGFWSKEEIFNGLLEHNQIALFLIALLVAGLTSFYMFRTYFLTFEGEYRGNAHPHNSSKVMTLPLIILAVPSAFLGVAVSGKFGFPSFDEFIRITETGSHNAENLLIPVASLLIALIGAGLASILYTEKFRKKFNVDLDNFIYKIQPIYNFSSNLWYIDKFYYNLVDYIVLPLSKLLAFFDRYIIDGIVNLVAVITRFTGWVLRLFQNGNVQTYLTILFGCLMFLTFIFIIYWLI